MAMPTDPIARPSSWGPLGLRAKKSPPMRAEKKGVAPLSRPVTAELMCVSASGKSVNGIPTHTTERTRRRPRSERSIRVREEGIKARASAPDPTRAQVMSPG